MKIDALGFIISAMVGFWTAIIGMYRVFAGYEFVSSLILTNVGICACWITYIAMVTWMKNKDD